MKKIARKSVLEVSPYIPGKPISEVKREYGLEKIIKIASNENPLGTPKEVLEKLKDSLDNMNIYPDGYCYDLRKKLSEKFGFDLNNFVFGDGTDEVLLMLF